MLQAFKGVTDQFDREIPQSEWARRIALERIRSDLLAIESKFTTQMPEISRVVEKKTPLLASLAGGLFGGLFLMIFWKVLQNHYRSFLVKRAC